MQNLQIEIEAKGKAIFSAAEGGTASIFNKDWWYGRIMDWSMKNSSFKTQMFRFVDVLPYLKSGSEVSRHLKEYFAEGGEDLPSVFSFGLGLGSLAPGIMASAIRKNVFEMAKMFIVGENPKEAIEVVKNSRKQKIATTVDLLGEATLSEKEALEYQSKYLELIELFAKAAKDWEPIDAIDFNHLGPIPKVNVSVKLSSLYSQINVRAWDETKAILVERLRPIFKKAIEHGVFVNLDMENYALKNLTLEVFEQMILEPEFASYPHWGVVIQAYLRDSLVDVDRLVTLAKKRKVPFTVRLVKGAYWDFETIFSEQRGWPFPVYTNKKESDVNFEAIAEVLLLNHECIQLALGSHNVRSLAFALVLVEKLKINPKAIEVQMLYGMADQFKKALVKMGVRVREYAPVGDLIPGMAYLVRRLLENTSNESFLRSKFAENISLEKLMANPRENLVVSSEFLPTKNKFYNEPLIDFAIRESREKITQAIANLRRERAKPFPLVIGKKEIFTSRFLDSVNPSNPHEVVGRVCVAGIEEADLAVKMAQGTFTTWKNISTPVRADILDRAADLLIKEKFQLMAIEVLETGKQWVEADGDVAEAIDFCRYYAQQIREISKPKRTGHVAGELSQYFYRPRGVALVIAPWNFPLAILAGMVAAAAVAGNTVIMKPAEQSPIIAAHLMRIFKEAGFPPGVINFLPGFGEEIGAHLVKHKDVQIISFTGSKEVGLGILRDAASILPGQSTLKKCVIEMGGKNAIIVDSDADLDEAVSGVLNSAFGYQGQKCSACSRVIVLEENYDRFVGRLAEAASSFEIGPAENPKYFMGPVIDEAAQKRILSTIKIAKGYARVLFQGEVPTEGYYVPPIIFVDVDPKSDLSQKEIFGPVLAVIKVKTIDDAIKVVNSVEFGLTAGLYSRSPVHIEKVKNELEVGNLYINRQITGAMVERHPFGGTKMSGVGSKTGGVDYLIQYMEPISVTENTLRRGFAPAEEDVTQN